jgi:nuclear transport factor 2 (NTF2) superfamily protein
MNENEIMATATITTRPPLLPFTRESATEKVRMAEDGWNTRDPEKVALAYTIDSRWRNRSEFISGRTEIIAFLSRKWARELDYRLIKELDVHRQSDRRALRLRMARRVRSLVPLLWQRELGIRWVRVNIGALCIHQ